MSEASSTTYWKLYGGNLTFSREAGGERGGQVMRVTKNTSDATACGFSREPSFHEFVVGRTYEFKIRCRCSASLAAKNKPFYFFTAQETGNVSGPAHQVGVWTEAWRTITLRSNSTISGIHISALGSGIEAGDWIEVDWIEAREIFIPMKYDQSGFLRDVDEVIGQGVVLTHFNKADADLWKSTVRSSINYDTAFPTDWAGSELSSQYLTENAESPFNKRIFSGTSENEYVYDEDGNPVFEDELPSFKETESTINVSNLVVYDGSRNELENKRIVKNIKDLKGE